MKKIYKLGVAFLFILIVNLSLVYASETLSGWYKGDQHVHTSYAMEATIPLSQMANSGINNYNLDWIIFTDRGNRVQL